MLLVPDCVLELLKGFIVVPVALLAELGRLRITWFELELYDSGIDVAPAPVS